MLTPLDLAPAIKIQGREVCGVRILMYVWENPRRVHLFALLTEVLQLLGADFATPNSGCQVSGYAILLGTLGLPRCCQRRGDDQEQMSKLCGKGQLLASPRKDETTSQEPSWRLFEASPSILAAVPCHIQLLSVVSDLLQGMDLASGYPCVLRSRLAHLCL